MVTTGSTAASAGTAAAAATALQGPLNADLKYLLPVLRNLMVPWAVEVRVRACGTGFSGLCSAVARTARVLTVSGWPPGDEVKSARTSCPRGHGFEPQAWRTRGDAWGAWPSQVFIPASITGPPHFVGRLPVHA